ncbi:Bacteriophage head to tail connecting protein [Methylobacillus rhizosphaerae]|uniref:Bacteriophage head to tail connecting protein n=1 Tax=Methylobacillus rhizosphaerae TaxID=551994 RepID=A0A238YRW5_9PROT|nr:portal protein [Methylobacillus rhizosphaerae]SNR73712.1 Bacteriophage head to tail connecting protein [Methylobacillus rhizosphaerae]
MAELTQRQQMISRWGALKNERSSWMYHWQEISDNLLPRNGRFFVTDKNRGEKKHNQILDSTTTRALRVLGAGMMAGLTSPARPWFRLTTLDPQLDESNNVKIWLAEVTRMMQMVFAKSNTYRALHSMYEELGAFGTSSNIVLSDYDSIIHHYPLTIGEFAIATDYRGDVDTLYREFQMTAIQMVRQFGKDNCSTAVQRLYDTHNYDAWVPVIHAIEPRMDREHGRRDAKNMPWQSVYFELGGDSSKVLSESGFRNLPALSPRWLATGGDIYGNSPGMEALGDIKQLYHEQLRKAQGIDYKTKPPLQVPTSMVNQTINTLPGGVSYVDPANPNGGIRSAFEVNLDLSHLLADIQDVRQRINSCFYVDLFLMLASSQNPQMTATEVAERHEEKMLMLGPVTERIGNEILDPLIDVTFSNLVENNLIPPPPEELQGRELNVEYIGMLAQAQRAIATNAVDRYVSSIGVVAGMKPEVLDKFDADKWADAYADMLGVDPELIVPGEQVALIREQRAQQQQQMQQAAMLNQGADTAQKLASAGTDDDNALTDITRALSGYT